MVATECPKGSLKLFDSRKRFAHDRQSFIEAMVTANDEGEVVSVALGDAITSQVQPEYFRDWMGLPYEPVLVKGGASVLEYQANAPLRLTR